MGKQILEEVRRKRLRIHFEEVVEYRPKKEKKETTDEKRLRLCMEARNRLMAMEPVIGRKSFAEKSAWLFSQKDFLWLRRQGEMYRAREVRSLVGLTLLLVPVVIAASILAGLSVSHTFPSWLPVVGVVASVLYAAFLIFWLRPKISYHRFFHQVFLPLCYSCAGAFKGNHVRSFSFSDLQGNEMPVKEWLLCNHFDSVKVSDKFAVQTEASAVRISKSLVKRKYPVCTTHDGRIHIAYKPMTVFNGQVFRLQMHKRIKSEDTEPLIYVLQKSVERKYQGISEDALEQCDEYTFRIGSLSEQYTCFVKRDSDISTHTLYLLEKRLIALQKQVPPCSLYIHRHSANIMMMNGHSRNDSQAELFASDFRHITRVSKGGFTGIIQNIAVVVWLENLLYILFGR